MKSYQAILTGGDTRDIGQFPTSDAAWQWALQEYGGNLAAVNEVTPGNYSIVVNKWELNPAWYALGIVAMLLMFAGGNKRKARKRVHRTR